jgi:hypothetical protein
MPHLERKQNWRGRLGWLAGELVVVFVGVSAAFVVDNYRDNKNQAAEFHQALAGVIAELSRTETRGREFADRITGKIAEWDTADRSGNRAIPGYYQIPGSTHPPTAAWNTMVASGLARLIEPKLRTELGYFYSEFIGIHDNYDRYNQFTEREVLPRVALGPDAFYGADGRLLPAFRVHMDLQNEFASDLRKLSAKAHDLRIRLEALQSSGQRR